MHLGCQFFYEDFMFSRTFKSNLTAAIIFGSINGENIHYGTPTNPCAADRVPGGSSSGSAVSVGATLVDFSLGELSC